ncbi:MAG TPA: YifB family Mg chelatase-like AAA ATPase [Chloroflexota bacterium]|nr:YifB family Mg chelatase-like AAA ATPase [Chloroflexota bacterium]
MLAKCLSAAVVGLEGAIVQVEIDISQGLPRFDVVGLPDAAVNEARQRVRAAIRNSGLYFPDKRITANLAPADLKKEGPAYDLPIAVCILAASEQLPLRDGKQLFLGELSLDGSLRHSAGILAMVMLAKEKGIDTVFVPAIDAAEAALVEGVTVLPIQSLADLALYLRGTLHIDPVPFSAGSSPCPPAPSLDLAEVRGQEHVRRGLEVAVAGGHNMLMTGPPGAGKTLIARAAPSIMPSMALAEALEVTKIYSVAGMLPPETPLILERPFRAPHHTTSMVGLVGGGRWPKPGEVSLAHRGVLFLDELPEFAGQALEVLRQPLEDGVVTISRASGTITLPANFMLIGAMNPCPCGFFEDPVRDCTCTSTAILKYQKKISGPLLDRIDIHTHVPRIEFEKLSGTAPSESSAEVRSRVEAARQVQAERFAGTGLVCNADMGPAEVRQFCRLDAAGENLMRTAMAKMHLSARAFHRLLKLARTIADMAGQIEIRPEHVAEALQYRPRELRL